MKLRNKLIGVLSAGVMAAVGVLGVVSSASAAGNDNPQLRPSGDAAAPNNCARDTRSGNGSIDLTLTNNVAYTLPNVAGWQTLRCTSTSFSVPRGQTAAVDLGYHGEFDASGPAGNGGWVQGRFVITPANAGASVLPILPDNTDRGDSFALDNSKGQYSDWGAHSLEGSTRVSCPSSVTATSCTFRVVAQGQLTAGADYFWYDDSTLTVETKNSATWGTLVRANNLAP